MAKRTKSQKKRLISDVEIKSRALYMEGLINAKDVEAISRICSRAYGRV